MQFMLRTFLNTKYLSSKNLALLLNNFYYIVQKKYLGLLLVRMQLGNLMTYPSRRINKIPLNIKEQAADEIENPCFAIQLNKSSDVSQYSQLLAFGDMCMRKISRKNFYFTSLLN